MTLGDRESDALRSAEGPVQLDQITGEVAGGTSGAGLTTAGGKILGFAKSGLLGCPVAAVPAAVAGQPLQTTGDSSGTCLTVSRLVRPLAPH